MSPALRNMWLRVRAEGPKAAILGGLLVVCAGLGLRAMLTGKKAAPPAQAAAMETATKDAGAPGSGAAAGKEANELDLSAPVRHARTRTPTRDVFAGDAKLFSDEGAIPGASGAPGAKSADGIDEVSGEDGALREAALRRRAEEDAAKCRLRSVALGSRPAAVIEFEDAGERKALVVQVGETIAGFKVEEITGAGVRITREGWEGRLEVVKPKK